MSSSNLVIRGNSLYTIVDGPSWTEAEANSMKLGGHLATINNLAENQLLVKSFKYTDPAPGSSGYQRNSTYPLHWIGLTDKDNEGSWEWSSSEPLIFTNWIDGKIPDDHTWYSANGADYASINYYQATPSDDANNGSWWNWSEGERSLGVEDDSTQGISETPFIRRGDSAYVIVEGPTWEEAEANANALGGHLVTINDAEENQWVVDTFKDKDLAYNPDITHPVHLNTYWIGLTRDNSQSSWSWISGEDVDYLNFGPKEPFNSLSHAAMNTQQDGDFNDADPNWWGNHYGSWADYGRETDALYGIAEIPLEPNNEPTGTPTLIGDFKVGETINIDVSSISDADNFEGWTPTYEYSWEVSNDNGTTWTALTGTDATDGDDSYTLTSDEVGKQLRGVVSYLDGYGTNEVVESDGTITEPEFDIITGTTGNDKLKGKKSSVHLQGLGGKDKLIGSKKDDILDGGYGNDVLNGKKGADIYVLSSGKDKFKGFKLKEGDTIQIDSDITCNIVQRGNKTLIKHDDGVSIVFNVSPYELASAIEFV